MKRQIIRIHTHRVFGVFALITACIVWVITKQQVKPSPVVFEYVNGRFIPLAIAAIMACCGMISLVKSCFCGDEDLKELVVTAELRNILFIIIVIIFGLIARKVSFLLASILFGASSLAFLRCKSIRRYLIVEITIVTITLIFRYALNVKFGGTWGI